MAVAFHQYRYVIIGMVLAGLVAGAATAAWEERLAAFETTLQISGLAVPQVIAPEAVQEYISRASRNVAREASESKKFPLPEGATTVSVRSPSTLVIVSKDRDDRHERVARYHQAILDSLHPESLIPSSFSADDVTKATEMMEEVIEDAKEIENEALAFAYQKNIRIQQYLTSYETLARETENPLTRMVANRMSLQLTRLQGYLNQSQTGVSESVRQFTDLQNVFSDAISIHPQNIAELKVEEPKTVSMAFAFSLLGLVMGCAIAFILYFIKMTIMSTERPQAGVNP